jgi:hypothetical protein
MILAEVQRALSPFLGRVVIKLFKVIESFFILFVKNMINDKV